MTLKILLRESITSARCSPVPSTLVLLVVAAMCFAAIVTVGRQAAVEAAIAEELSGPAARATVISDTTGEGVATSPTINVLAGLDGVSTVIGRSNPLDVVNGALGEGSSRVAAVELHGEIETAVEIRTGRLPGPQEAIVPHDLLEDLRMAEPTGYVEATDGRQWSIVGAFDPTPPFDDFSSTVITAATPQTQSSIQQITVVAESPTHSAAVRDSSLAVIDAHPESINVSTPSAASTTVQAVSGELAGYGRFLLGLIMGVGSFFVAAVVLADVLIRRRDLGRRRTLGITRSALIALVGLRTCFPTIIGGVVGTAAAQSLMMVLNHNVPWDFTTAIPVIAVITATLASLAPASYAATRDPVTIMRTP